MKRPIALAVAVVAAALLVPSVPAPPAHAAASPQKLIDAYFKAKKDAAREKAWAAIEAAEPLDSADVRKLAERAVVMAQKRGRKIDKGGGDWFDKKKDGWAGRYLTSGKAKGGLVLGLHGGGAGSGDAGQAASSFSGGVSKIKMRGIYPEVLQKTEYGWTDPPATEKWILELLRAARRTWKIDPDRVYVTGHSMGGYGTWTYGSIHADLFAAGAAFAGAPTVYWVPGRKDKEAEAVVDGTLPNLYNLPLFVYQSLDDPNVPAAANVHACARLKELHESDPKGWKHVYEEVDGRGHAFPAKGPGPGLAWMASHVRNPRPETIRWQPVRDWKTTFYWVRWTKPWLSSELVATLDRDANRIDLVVTKPRSATPNAEQREAAVSTLSVYLDERLVDLSKEVVVTVDGKERHRAVPELRLTTLVRTAEEREDVQYVFAAEAAVRPAPKTGE